MADLSDNLKASVTLQRINKDIGATYYSINPTYQTNKDWLEKGFLPTLDANPKKGNNIIDQDVLGKSDLKNTYENLNIEYSSSKVKFQSITSMNKVDRSMTGDLDFTRLDIANFGFDQGERNNTKSFNQEFRLNNASSSSQFDWTIGGFYQKVKRDFFQSDLTFSDEFAVTNYTATFNTIAFFGFADYKLSDKLTVSSGLRFDSDKFDLDDFLNKTKEEKSANVLQPKISLSYQGSKNVLVYTNYGRGYRAGGFNPKVTTLFNRDFRKEISDNFELGFKTSSWGSRFIFNGSVFYSDFTDRQQTIYTTDDFTPGNYNYDKSRIMGFEFDTKLRVSKYLDILFNYGRVKSTIIKGEKAGGAKGEDQDLNKFDGNNTALVPQNNFNIGLQTHFSVSDKSTIDASLNYNPTGKIYWHDANDDFAASDAYQLLDFRATLNVNNLKFTLWGRNILDTQYYKEHLATTAAGWRGTPATFGTTISLNF